MIRLRNFLITALVLLHLAAPRGAAELPTHRPPRDEADLRSWLENMAWYHRFSTAELSAALGLTPAEVEAALTRHGVTPDRRPRRYAEAAPLVLPYPGGRHPRLGFLDGAVRPQRETKVSVFTPWDEHSYVVVDVPEAIWSNLGLTYLAHTHVPTLWTKQNIDLPPHEWRRLADGSLEAERRLPNGIAFGARVNPVPGGVRMDLWLTNGTKEPLTDLRVQNCVLLRGAAGFEGQTNDNKVFRTPYVACKSADGRRWILTGWEPCHRAWANPPCPCLHSDPKFPDCPPGATRRVRGWLSFYEGTDLDAELRRLDASGWRQEPTVVTGSMLDAATNRPLPCRVYVRGADGAWHFPRSEGGTAVTYRKQWRHLPECAEMHTTLSAHPFRLDLPPGKYTITVEHGKEYLPQTREITVDAAPLRVDLSLKRWINLPARGWYSGDTHVHRSLEELPTAMLAEDLNVAFPLTAWVTEAFAPPPIVRDLPARPIPVDATHVIYPRNTEYEIFTVRKKSHTLGAFFVLNHQAPLPEGVPPLRPVLERARREGALIELDKHNWPWSMALIPVMKVDLFELSNNHVWRTSFGFPTFGEPAPAYMKIERDARGFTERGWLDYGFQNYYALLNCGFRLRPTAGTAAGVHPVPLGFGRVYVHCGDGFSAEAWLRGLNEGRSFVTTGPMLFVQANEKYPGHTFRGESGPLRLTGSAWSEEPLARIEVVVNGEVVRTLKPANRKGPTGGHESPIDEAVALAGSSWVAVRCFEERPGGRLRFAHTGPFHVEMEGKPLRPRREEVEFLSGRVAEQLRRSASELPEAALEEYRQALQAYRELARTAR